MTGSGAGELSVEDYRRRAADARRTAEQSQDAALRESYELLALQWERLAAAVEMARRW